MIYKDYHCKLFSFDASDLIIPVKCMGILLNHISIWPA